ncbi:MAG: di-trans,poly-cis-decaprenylcistransferase [Clostridium sp.]|nr:di-trans,poly-cis-decaprenylcistransferase [Clostridium sp.]
MSDKDTKSLKHILFIMDGNGRWAKKRLLPRTAGHLAGVKRIKEIVDECFLTYQIPYVSLFCFSSENWNRPEAEVSTLFKLLKEFFSSNIEDFKSKGVKVRVVGDLADKRIPTDILNTINEAMEETKELNKYNFTVLFNYGGRQDVVQATKRFASLYKEGKVELNSLNVKSFEDYLWTKDLPDVDLMVRTSGELRVSNCYLYQLAYAEMEFPKTYWPDYSVKSLKESLDDFYGRNRRFGAIKE